MRSIPRASRACSRRSARDTRPSIRRPKLYADVPCASLPDTLAAAGYRTALFHSGRFDYLGMPAIDRAAAGSSLLEDAGAIGGQVNSSFGVDDASTVRRMLQWIASLGKEERFFLTYLPVAGHNPYEVTRPGPFNGTGRLHPLLERAARRGRGARRAARGAARAGHRGRHARDRVRRPRRGLRRAPGQLRAHDVHLRRERARALPDRGARRRSTVQRRVQRVASIIDTAPTILDLLGLPADAAAPGNVAAAARSLAWRCSSPTTRSAGSAWPMDAGSISSRWTPVDRGSSTSASIPARSRDRAPEFPERVSGYRARVREWAAAQKDAMDRR